MRRTCFRTGPFPVTWLTSLPVKRPPLRRILRNFAEHTSGQGTWSDVTSGQKASLRRILRNFRLRMRRTHFRHFRSLPLAPPQMLTELYPYTTLDYPIIASDQFNVYHFKATFFNLCSANHISFYVLYTFCKFPIIRGLCYDKLLGTYKVRNEIETKRNQRKRNETKRNQRNKTKPTKAKRNQRNRLIWRKWKEKNKRQNEIKK
jgi:hypothetical protein